MKPRHISLLLPALLLSACASYSGIHTETARVEASTLGAQATATEWPAHDWWQRFGDATLNQLIDTALAGNPSLQQADARLR
ncbi:MAG TPA: RND transporter, partial [Rhodocyclaceae bacterium]|nr:RND transporter [Rhodocyclaceae bacterium]